MDQYLKEVNEEYKKILQSAGSKGKSAKEQMEELNKKMLEKNFTLKGKPFPTFLKPLFVRESMKEYFKNTTNIIMNCIEKITELYFSSPEYEPYFELDPFDKELALIDHRYPRRVIQARLDAFLGEDGLTFLEFNCDSPSGMGWHDQLIGMIAELPVIQELDNKYKTYRDPILPTFYKMLRQKNREYGNPEDITFAIVCNRESSIRYDVELIIEHFNKKEGHRTIFADPRDGVFDGESFKVNGETVGLVYRDAIQDFTGYWDDVQNMMNAYKAGKLCLINPFSSRVGGLKCVLWFMTDEKCAHLFTEEEKKVIAKTIPWTRFMKQGKTNYHDETIDLFPFVSKNKDKFVLKPNAGYGGHGVTIGKEVEQKVWDEVVESATKESWVVQEFVDIPKEEFPIFNPDLDFNLKNVNINFFAFNGQFGGSIVRVSDSSIINVHQGGGMIPICYVP